MSCVLVLLMTIVLWLYLLDLSPFGGASTPPFISRGRGYKEGNRVSYNKIPILTLSLLAYFTYIYRYNYLRLGEHAMVL
jgi:hypothetical protein